MSAHAEPAGHGPAAPRERERASAADPLQLADLPADRRDLPLHRVGDHALRLVLHGLLLRPRRQPRRIRRGRPTSPARTSSTSGRGSSRSINTFILVTSSFTMHWATQSIKRGHRAGLCAGMVLTLLLGTTFLLTQVIEYHRIGFNTSDTAFAATFFGLTGLHACPRLHRPHDPARDDGQVVPRPLQPGGSTTGSRSAGSTGTSST